MKKLKYLFLALVFLSQSGFAEKVNINTIKKIAIKAFIQNYAGIEKNEIVIEKMIPYIKENDTLFYVVNLKQNGFVIISADNVAPPVLGYCLKNKFDSINIPSGFNYLLTKYKNSIYTLRKENTEPSLEIKSKWEQLLGDKTLETKSMLNTVIGPLCNTTWAQGYSYNMYCPEDNGSHV